MDYKLKYDLHTHTTYSHGKGSIMDNAKAAYAKGLGMIGIADHGPGHKFYGINMKKLPAMRRDVNAAKEAFPAMEIKLGVEANIINKSGNLDVSKEDQKLFDFIIAGYHYGVLGEQPLRAIGVCIGGYIRAFSNVVYNTDLIVRALYENPIRVLTHPDDKINVDIDEIAEACEKTNTLMEINNHHLSLHSDSIKKAMKYNVKFIISSDAHYPGNVGAFNEALKLAQDAGLPPERIVNLWTL